MAKWIERDARFAHYIAEGLDPNTMQGLTCACCGREVKVGAHTSDTAAATLDHMTARATTGDKYDTTPTNLITLCASCNSSKQALDMAAFLANKPADFAAAAWGRIGARLSVKGDMRPWISASRAAGFGRKK